MNEPHTEEEIIEMFTDVERRPEPPREAMDRAFAAVEEEWESVVSQRRRRVQRRRWAVAAAVLVAVAGTFAGLRVTMAPAPTALLVQGDVVIGGGSAQGAADSALAAADSMPAAPGTTLAAPGTTLELDPAADIVSRTASRWVSEAGVDVRLAQDSRVRWTRTDEIELLEGTVYVATDGAAAFAVDTRFGRVLDIGTRYQVRAFDDRVEVAVREGRVQLTSPHGEVLSDEVDEITTAVLAAHADGVFRFTEPSTGQRWEWIHEAPAGYASDEPLVLLRDIARDLGKQLRFQSIGVEASLAPVRVDGDFTGMAPLDALQILAAATSIRWQDEGDAILVDLTP